MGSTSFSMIPWLSRRHFYALPTFDSQSLPLHHGGNRAKGQIQGQLEPRRSIRSSVTWLCWQQPDWLPRAQSSGPLHRTDVAAQLGRSSALHIDDPNYPEHEVVATEGALVHGPVRPRTPWTSQVALPDGAHPRLTYQSWSGPLNRSTFERMT